MCNSTSTRARTVAHAPRACLPPAGSREAPDVDTLAASGTPPALHRRTGRSNALCPLGLQDRIYRYCEYSTGSLGVYDYLGLPTLGYSRGICGHACMPVVVVGLARGVCSMSLRMGRICAAPTASPTLTPTNAGDTNPPSSAPATSAPCLYHPCTGLYHPCTVLVPCCTGLNHGCTGL